MSKVVSWRCCAAIATLTRRRPVLLIEASAEFEGVKQFLDRHGYRRFGYDSEANRLLPGSGVTGVNVFGLPDERC